jgi:hypothetical protein
VIVLDTGGLFAALDANEALHGRAVAALVASTPPRVVSPFVLAELDYLIGRRAGHQAQMALIDEVTRGAYQLESFSPEASAMPGASWSVTPISTSDSRTRPWSCSQPATERSTSCVPTSATSVRFEVSAASRSDSALSIRSAEVARRGQACSNACTARSLVAFSPERG